MRGIVGNFISVVWSFFRFLVFKLFHLRTFRCHAVERVSPNVVTELSRGGKLSLGKKVRIHSGSKLKVRGGAVMTLGDNVRVNYNCIFIARERITVGEGTEFGPGVLIYDHDHDFRSGLKNGGFVTSPVTIGKNAWIGAGSILLRGAEIGDNAVIAAGSVVTGKVPENTVFVQKRAGECIAIGGERDE